MTDCFIMAIVVEMDIPDFGKVGTVQKKESKRVKKLREINKWAVTDGINKDLCQ